MVQPNSSINNSYAIQPSKLQQSEQQIAGLQRQLMNPKDKDHQKLKKAAQDFEAVFIQQLLDAMDKTIDRSDSVLSGGHAEEVFRGMLNQNIATSMTHRLGNSGFGLAEAIYKQMSQVMNAQKSAVNSGTSPDGPSIKKAD